MVRRLSLMALLATSATLAHADESAIRATMQRIFPQNPSMEITNTPVAGVFEAAVDGRIFYVTEDGKYIFIGPLIDAEAKKNLTDARLEQLNALDFDSLNLDWAIKWVNGTGARKIAVFEDPDCPYCRVLEQTLRSIDNLTVYVFLYPIDEIHPQAAAKSVAVWCAPDPAKAWETVMRTGEAPTSSTPCANPIANIAEFAKRHRISSTPTTILANGRRLVGAVPRPVLENELLRSAKP